MKLLADCDIEMMCKLNEILNLGIVVLSLVAEDRTEISQTFAESV